MAEQGIHHLPVSAFYAVLARNAILCTYMDRIEISWDVDWRARPGAGLCLVSGLCWTRHCHPLQW